MHWKKNTNKHSLRTKITLFTLLIFVASIWALAYFSEGVLHEEMETISGQHQMATVTFVAAEVRQQLDDRFRALHAVAAGITPAMMGKAQTLQNHLEQRPVMGVLFNGGSYVAGPNGTALASIPTSANRVGLNYLDRENVVAALQKGLVGMSSVTVGKALKGAVFSMAVPVSDAQGRVVGVLVGVINLAQPNFLDVLTQSRFGATGGYLVVSKSQRLIVTASDRKRAMEVLPAVGVVPSIDRLIGGYEGSEVFVNTRGVEVLASAKGIPLTDWFVAVSQPTDEAFASIYSLKSHLWLAALLLTALAGALMYWMIRRQLAPLLSTAQTLAGYSASDHRIPELPVVSHDEIGNLITGFNRLLERLSTREDALQVSEDRYRTLVDKLQVGVLLQSATAAIELSNQSALDLLGVTLDQMLGKTSFDPTWNVIHEDGTPFPGDTHPVPVAIASRTAVRDVVMGVYRPVTQDRVWLLVNADPQLHPDGSVRQVICTFADITARKHTEEKLMASEASQKGTLEALPDLMFELDQDGRYHAYHPPADAQVVKPAENLLGSRVSDWMPPEAAGIVMAALKEANDYGRSHGKQLAQELPEGRRWFELSVARKAVVGDEGPRFIVLSRDISERMQAEARLQLFAMVFNHAREAIMVVDASGTIVEVNDSFTRITGYTRTEAMGSNPRILSSGRQDQAFYAGMWAALTGQGHWYGEIWNRRKNGEVYAEMLTITAVRDAQGGIVQYVSLFSDITYLKDHQSQLEHMAHFDVLTGLPNRTLLADRVQQSMSQTQRRKNKLAVAFLDLDDFKAINDTHGHAAGDQMLVALAARMKQVLREGDTLSRLGGDEFVAVLVDLADTSASTPLLARLLAAAAQPVQVGDLLLQVSASLGVTFYPQAEEVDPDQLLRQADQAMYRAKLAGKNNYHVFDSEEDRSVRGLHESLDHIRQALAQQEFLLYYQPKVNMRTGAVIGAEALIRWQHPQRGMLPPAVFLPAVENHPLAIALGEWVIDEALRQMAAWQADGLEMRVSVNVGARQLQQLDFVDRLQVILKRHPTVQPSHLEIEVLETSALEDVARVSRVIEVCRGIGVTFALDDFGTGYSSLTYLKRLPAGLLKIDQSFVRDMLDDPDDLAILEGVIGLASAFRREVIAEGVETIEHGELLMRLGCDLAQGYGIARPMPADKLPGWTAAWRPDPRWVDIPVASRDELPMLFAGVEHRAWFKAVEFYLKDERDHPPSLAVDQCHFGTWVNGPGQQCHGSHGAFPSIRELHLQTHTLAAELCRMKAHGQGERALVRVRELHSLGDLLLEQVRLLM